jgi:hypothetical protein
MVYGFKKGGDCCAIKDSVKVTYPDNNANGERVPKRGYICTSKIESIKVTSLYNIANGIRIQQNFA